MYGYKIQEKEKDRKQKRENGHGRLWRLTVVCLLFCLLTAGCGKKPEEVRVPENITGEGELAGTDREVYPFGENGGQGEYYVILPPDYDAEARSYPTVYLMPYDGFHAGKYVEDGIVRRLSSIMESKEAMEVVTILPAFVSGQDYDEMLPALVEDVEKKYSVIPDARYRGILGVNVGGYMSYEAVLIGKTELFGCVGSHMGDFSETNPYQKKGSIFEAVEAFDRKPDCGYEYLSGYFFYLDAPNSDDKTTAENGSAMIGSGLEKRTNPLYRYGSSEYDKPDNTIVDFAVLDGKADQAYYLQNLARSYQKYCERFSAGLYTVSLEPEAKAVADNADSLSGKVRLTIGEELSRFVRKKEQVKLTVTVADEAGKEEYASQEFVVPSDKEAVLDYSILRKDLGNLEKAKLICGIELLGMSHEADGQPVVFLQKPVAGGENSYLDLRGNWYFKAYKEYGDQSKNSLDSIGGITENVYKEWNVVQPAFGWWDAKFDESLQGNDNYAGYAWYVRSFDLDAEFAKEDLKLAVGCFDEANEVYLNGKLIGSTGVEFVKGVGVYDGSNPWDVKCVYDIDSNVLRYGRENVIAIRMCNSTGAGGWYDGPIGLYTAHSYAKREENSGNRHFYAATYQPSVLSGVEQTYRIYLPKEYLKRDNQKAYPVMFLLHGINSTGKSFEIDGIDKVLDDAIENGEIDPMIVVMPDDPSKQSFWMGKYEKMVVKDLWAEICSKYRISEEVSDHYVAGCSMGGAGAMHIGLNNPGLFGGIISFYGAFPYTDVQKLAAKMSEEQLAGYRLWMACGNEDQYDFYEAQEEFSRLLSEKGIGHYHYVDDGIHGSSFYLPLFVKAVKYVQGK